MPEKIYIYMAPCYVQSVVGLPGLAAKLDRGHTKRV